MYPRWLIYCCEVPIQGVASVTLCPLLHYLLQKQRLFQRLTQNERKQSAAALLASHPRWTLQQASGLLYNVHVHVGGAEFILRMYTSQEKALNVLCLKVPFCMISPLRVKPFVHQSVLISVILTHKFFYNYKSQRE